MSLSFFIAALLGKAAAGATSKGFAAKASAAGTKGAHHAHRALGRRLAGKVVNKASDEVIDAAVSKVDAAMANRKKAKAPG